MFDLKKNFFVQISGNRLSEVVACNITFPDRLIQLILIYLLSTRPTQEPVNNEKVNLEDARIDGSAAHKLNIR